MSFSQFMSLSSNGCFNNVTLKYVTIQRQGGKVKIIGPALGLHLLSEVSMAFSQYIMSIKNIHS